MVQQPSNSLSYSANSSSNKSKNNKNNRGRFLQLRRSQKKTVKTATIAGVGSPLEHGGAARRRGASSSKSSSSLSSNNNRSDINFRRLSSLKENSVGISSSSSSVDSRYDDNHSNQYNYRRLNPQPNQQQQRSMFIGDGFSRAELYDLEESFKLFDVYGEGSVQVGDLRNILGVLQQEQQSVNANDTSFYYPHLNTLLHRLSELSDEDNLTMDDYVKLMSSTSITNDNVEDNDNHFARVFRLFDVDGKNFITVSDLQRVAIELGEHDMTMEEVQEMIDRAKRNNNKNGIVDDGKVYIDDFTRIMTSSLFPRTATTANGMVEREEH